MGAYAPPSIGAAGLTVPAYQAILNLFISNLQAIYGPSIYLGDDSADYQMTSVYALAMSDAYNALVQEYSNRAPNFAVGAALSSLVKLNGLARKIASYSTAAVTLTGTPGTTVTILNGLVRDSVPGQGFLWQLPSPVTIPASGVLNTVVVCQTIGAVQALPGQLNIIASTTAGWNGVNNPASAVLGQPVETDSQLRTRQAISTELPSITELAGTIAGVNAVEGVTRTNILENPTNAVDSYGNPPHSLTCVVEGGTLLAVATAIYNNRGIGCYTNGTTTQDVTDPNSGVVFPVNFYLPTYEQIFVIVNVTPLTGFSATIGQAIQTNIVNYLNGLEIGELVSYGALVYSAMSANPNISVPAFTLESLFLGTSAGPTETTDIQMLFNEVAQTNATQVQVNT